MQRYEARPAPDGWTVYDSLTREVLTIPRDQDGKGGAVAYSALLNDLESIGRAPPAERRYA